jgi:phosphohistidine phosphatase
MELYVVRHGIAETGGEGMSDASRALTGKGRRRFQKTARAFGKRGNRLDLVLTSPLVRAVQTAEILAGAADPEEVAVLEELDPRFDVESLRTAVAKRAGKAEAVAIVGHEPQLSSLLAALSGVSQSDLDLKKGSIVRIDVDAMTDGNSVDPRWWLKPRSGNRVKGLPLQKKSAAEKKVSARDDQSRPQRKRNGKKDKGGARPPRSGAAPAESRATN